MVKRGKIEIMRDILELIRVNRNFIKPTPLLRKSGLSSTSFKEYYNQLKEKDLIVEFSDKQDKRVSLTEKGTRFLEKYRIIVNFIEEFEL